ncbi:Mss4-like protein [Glarea lozoyensis ATCC 20868]|uniref:Mss4-like protein n=1 Tax=Glarea lozoyensis (strain ATCC 20868 / MF5171) TaxID=1116229 RepID=S3D828_GLAL2|nr:Mss4-like protein [Glarea lozoyensis ATCC 20868]EPE28171.1 Mss4-like protein [Glarea lozoyensis ATCC 20868]
MASQPSTYTYSGSCHCRSVNFTFKFPMPLTSTLVTNCNCTLCTKNGTLNICRLKKDISIQGEEKLASYVRSDTGCVHLFCSGCGSSMFTTRDGDLEMYMNVRMVDDVDLEALRYRKHDGRSVQFWMNVEGRG